MRKKNAEQERLLDDLRISVEKELKALEAELDRLDAALTSAENVVMS